MPSARRGELLDRTARTLEAEDQAFWAARRSGVEAHGVGGLTGAVLTGIFAEKVINAAGNDGLLFGNPGQLLVQVVAVAAVALYAFFGTWVILKFASTSPSTARLATGSEPVIHRPLAESLYISYTVVYERRRARKCKRRRFCISEPRSSKPEGLPANKPLWSEKPIQPY